MEREAKNWKNADKEIYTQPNFSIPLCLFLDVIMDLCTFCVFWPEEKNGNMWTIPLSKEKQNITLYSYLPSNHLFVSLSLSFGFRANENG